MTTIELLTKQIIDFFLKKMLQSNYKMNYLQSMNLNTSSLFLVEFKNGD